MPCHGPTAAIPRRACLAVLSMSLMLGMQPSASAAETRPNVLMIIVDDLNTALGSYGHPTAVTPHMDALAARGVRFERAYVQYPLCNPSRASFLSGTRPGTTRVYTGGTPPREAVGAIRMLPEHFADHGYRTARIGKVSHDRFNDSVSWDISENTPVNPYDMPGTDRSQVRDNTWVDGAEDGLTRDQMLRRLGRRAGLPLVWRATDQTDAQTPDGGTARRVADLLTAHGESGTGEPFFIAAGFHKPHLPWVAPRTYFDQHPLDTVGLPVTVENDRADMPRAAYRLVPDYLAHTPEQVRQARAAYHATVSLVDTQVGLVLNALETSGLADNTIVVFFSDHGFLLGEHGGLWSKHMLFEEATRVPLIVALPDGPHGAVSDAFVELVDLYPTLLDLAGLPAPAHLEGTSFAGQIADPDAPGETAAFSEIVNGSIHGRSVRSGPYRYTEWHGAGTVDRELYDLAADPGEHHNLAEDPSYGDVVQDLAVLIANMWPDANIMH